MVKAKAQSWRKNLVQRIIEIGYDMPAQRGGVLFFRVGATPANTADWIALHQTIGKIEYGNFEGYRLMEMLQHCTAMLALVEFGREYSPVVYLHFDPNRNEKLARGEARAIDRFLEMAKTEFGIEPDEETWDPSRYCLRLWWD